MLSNWRWFRNSRAGRRRTNANLILMSFILPWYMSYASSASVIWRRKYSGWMFSCLHRSTDTFISMMTMTTSSIFRTQMYSSDSIVIVSNEIEHFGMPTSMSWKEIYTISTYSSFIVVVITCICSWKIIGCDIGWWINEQWQMKWC